MAVVLNIQTLNSLSDPVNDLLDKARTHAHARGKIRSLSIITVL